VSLKTKIIRSLENLDGVAGVKILVVLVSSKGLFLLSLLYV